MARPNAHFVWTSALNGAHSFTRRPPRDGRKNAHCGGKEKSAKCCPPSSPPPSSSILQAPTLFLAPTPRLPFKTPPPRISQASPCRRRRPPPRPPSESPKAPPKTSGGLLPPPPPCHTREGEGPPSPPVPHPGEGDSKGRLEGRA